jgi:hypothetical protein
MSIFSMPSSSAQISDYFRVLKIALQGSLGPGSQMQMLALNLVPRSLTGTFLNTL